MLTVLRKDDPAEHGAVPHAIGVESAPLVCMRGYSCSLDATNKWSHLSSFLPQRVLSGPIAVRSKQRSNRVGISGRDRSPGTGLV